MTPTWPVPPGRSGNSTLLQDTSQPLNGEERANAGARNSLTARTALNGARSCGFCKEGEALDFIQDGHIEFDGELPLNTFGSNLGTDASMASGTSSKARCRHRAAPDRARSRTPTCHSSAPAPIVTGTTFIFFGDPY
jgi:hypothetical protein